MKKVGELQKSRQADFYAKVKFMPGYFLQVHTKAGMNTRMHWRKKAKIAKAERFAGRGIGGTWVGRVTPPFTVIFTRYSVGQLDSDALPNPFKSYRDGIADAFGVDDGPKGPIKWEYRQEKCPRGCYGFRVTVFVPPVTA